MAINKNYIIGFWVVGYRVLVLPESSTRIPTLLTLCFRVWDSGCLILLYPLPIPLLPFFINKGKNPYLAEKCKTLDEYETLVAKAREFHAEFEGMEGLGSMECLEKALGKAVNWCIEHGILKNFLEENSTEVNNMLFTEWNWDDALEVAREEGHDEGLEEGVEKGRDEGIEVGIDRFYDLLEQGYTPKEAREMLKNKSRVMG
jgi:hypothetical protein